MSNWKTAYERYKGHDERAKHFRTSRLSYGIDFLDRGLGGILPDDLVLVGAPSGVGKTNFITNIAKENVLRGKRVHVIALEAYEGEIEDRIQYNILATAFYKDKERTASGNLSFRGWMDGKFDEVLEKYRESTKTEMQSLENMFTYYSQKDFTINTFMKEAFEIKDKTDLIILDHVHYFDLHDSNENKALKEIVKKIRWVTLETGVPVVLVSHLRKKDKQNGELAAGIDEFHGSSDLSKMATKVISIGRGQMEPGGKTATTYFRIPKMRMDGSVTFYCAKLIFDFRLNNYDDSRTQIGIFEKAGKVFSPLDPTAFPDWFKGRR